MPQPAWVAVVHNDGTLKSVGTAVQEEPGEDCEHIDLPGKPDLAQKMWNKQEKEFVDRPTKVIVDRMDDLRNHASLQTLLGKLTAGEKDTLFNVIGQMFAPYRYRNQNAGADIDD